MPGIDEFQLVTYRKKRAANVRIRCNNLNTPESNDNNSDNETEFCDIHFGKLLEAEVELKNSSFADDVFHSLNDSLNALNANGCIKDET
ncbi:uncharacterized protein LOC143183915 isoform X6 [Calliopsis andreniformis]|uniref:uncharacterized protein LOC143183915 isoform X6 n=1 Tax=Calliopsis andreniformis TaxID=337506 RepID=UPI003FCD680C